VIRQIGGNGDAPAGLKDPRGVAVDGAGNVYVADSGHEVVKKFDPNGTYLATIGAPGQGDPQSVPDGQLLEPVAVALDPAGEVLVLDAQTGWISRFGPDGKLVAKFGGPSAQFYHPRDLKVDADGNIYIADAGTSHVTIFNPQGALVKRAGEHGTSPGQLMEPVSAAPGPSNQLLVADTASDRLTLFDGGFQPLALWSIPHASSVEGPHVALAPDGSFYLTDPPDHRVVHFDASDTPVEQLGAAGQLTQPVGIFVSPDGKVYVADSALGEVVVFGA
jgi:DNA-binding beta-propeller fold protein YncE